MGQMAVVTGYYYANLTASVRLLHGQGDQSPIWCQSVIISLVIQQKHGWNDKAIYILIYTSSIPSKHEGERTGSFIKCGLHCMKLVQYTLIILLLPHGFFILYVAISKYKLRVFVCLFAVNAKATARINAKSSEITKNDLESVLSGLKLPVLVFSGR